MLLGKDSYGTRGVIWRLTLRTLRLDVIGKDYQGSIPGIHGIIEGCHEVIVHITPLR
jgi:hypothetical protein